MKRNNEIRRCKCGCNRELPTRYKGREKIFFSPECRKIFNNIPLTKKEKERLANIN